MKYELTEALLTEISEAVSAGMMEFISPLVIHAMIRDMRRMRQEIEDLDGEKVRLQNALELLKVDHEHLDDELREAQVRLREKSRPCK